MKNYWLDRKKETPKTVWNIDSTWFEAKGIPTGITITTSSLSTLIMDTDSIGISNDYFIAWNYKVKNDE